MTGKTGRVSGGSSGSSSWTSGERRVKDDPSLTPLQSGKTQVMAGLAESATGQTGPNKPLFLAGSGAVADDPGLSRWKLVCKKARMTAPLELCEGLSTA